jgi:hypothetical protein
VGTELLLDELLLLESEHDELDSEEESELGLKLPSE